jgi:hypothetical protein
MSRILKVSESNYRLQVKSGGKIYLDTGTLTGDTIVTGNLTVLGTTTNIESTNASIADNIIILNDGEPNVGVTLNGSTSGIRIDRGQRTHSTGTIYDAELVFDENISHYDPILDNQVDGTFVLQTTDGALNGLKLASISPPDSYDMVFDMGNSLTKLRVVNATVGMSNYEDRVIDPNDIPNKQYVNDYVAASGGIATVDRVYYPISGGFPAATSSIRAYSSNINFEIAHTLVASITATGLTVSDINLYQDTISNVSVGNNLILNALTNTVEVDAVLKLNDKGIGPTAVAGSTKIYTVDSDTTPAPGKTGIYFTNQGNSDELIAKNRALLFSMLF